MWAVSAAPPDHEGDRMHALGEYLSEMSQQRGWSVSELARRAGLTKQSVSNLLADKDHLGRMLEPRTFNGLAEALGVPAEVLVMKAAQAMGIPVPPPASHAEVTRVDSPPSTMEDLTAFLVRDVPNAVLVTYLHRYLELAQVVGEALAVKHGYEWTPPAAPAADPLAVPAAAPGDGAGGAA